MRHQRVEHQFVQYIPEQLSEGVLYISMEYGTAAHSCCCGCGEQVVTPFTPTDWKMIYDGESVSLWPSIGNWTLACRSHYMIDRGRVLEAGPWSDRQIAAERSRDHAAKGMVVPTGYSFNLDGTNIYMTLAALFIAQATNVDLSLSEQLALLLVAMISSKGAAGITGAGFITLAATLSIVPSIPVAGMALILGVDRFMSECRALTNFIGNAVATIVVARWEGELDRDALNAALAGSPAAPPGPTPMVHAAPGLVPGQVDAD